MIQDLVELDYIVICHHQELKARLDSVSFYPASLPLLCCFLELIGSSEMLFSPQRWGTLMDLVCD